MKKILMVLIAVAIVIGGYFYWKKLNPPPAAVAKVTLQLKWVAQAQFAGYYAAQKQGFYKDAGLDVTINPGGPNTAPEQVIAGGGADVIVDWMPAALASREKGNLLASSLQSRRHHRPQSPARGQCQGRPP